MQLETINSSLFALGAAEAAAVFGGAVAPGRTWGWAYTFYGDGTVFQDPYEID